MSKSKLIQNIASLGIVQIVNYIFPLITIPYISRIIGPEGYGIINYATAFIAYFTLLVSYGFDLTATRKIAKINPDNKIDINRIVSEVFFSRVILFLLSTILFIVTFLFSKPLNSDPFVAIILFIGCLGTVISPQYLYQGFQDLIIFAKINFFKGLLNAILIFLLIKKTSDYIILPIISSSFLIGINLFLFLYALKKYKIKLIVINLKEILRIIYSERIIFFSTVVISLYTTTNVVVLGFFVLKEEVGYYTTSQNFLNIIISILAMPLSTALFPYISKSFASSKEEGIKTVQRIIPLVFYITLFASFCLLFLAPHLIDIIYGSKFYNSIITLKIISFLPFVICLSNIFGIQLMLNMGLDKLFLLLTTIASLLGILLNIYMSITFGYIGTAWNCLIVESFVTFLMYIALRNKGINVFVLENFRLKYIYNMFINLKK
ncbi:flippase [Chishuiella changwenlii]|uniref:flippase n=1 Tax=Chishuiella changwenlii TaxID=1434701 RepID=UPI0009334C0F|nr:flippase [Chishuiella changwenlii]